MSCNRPAQAGYVAFSLAGARLCYTCEFLIHLGAVLCQIPFHYWPKFTLRKTWAVLLACWKCLQSCVTTLRSGLFYCIEDGPLHCNNCGCASHALYKIILHYGKAICVITSWSTTMHLHCPSLFPQCKSSGARVPPNSSATFHSCFVQEGLIQEPYHIKTFEKISKVGFNAGGSIRTFLKTPSL